VNTSSITVSTIAAAGAITDFLSGDPTKLGISWFVGLDGSANVSDVLKGDAGDITYRDTATANVTTGNEIEVLREEITAGSAQIGYITDTTNAAATGFRFISSLNGGADATAILGPTTIYPLGGQLAGGLTIGTCPAGVSGIPITDAFSTIAGHTYSIDLHIEEEQTTGVPNPPDRMSYSVDGNVVLTLLHSEISTLNVTDPEGRMLHGVFTASGVAAQVVIGNNTGSAQSTIVVPTTVGLNGLLVRDLGPTGLIIAP
jgi:hypothetical protein